MRTMALAVGIATALAPAVGFAFPVTIDPGAYGGRYVVAGQLASGVTAIDLAAGSYDFDDGISIGGSNFFFTVDGAGQVQSNNAVAAQGVGATLRIANTTITVDPGAYPYGYYPVAGTFAPQSGVTGVVVIPGLRFAIDDGTFVGNSDFIYDVDAAGQVSCTTPSAICAGTTVSIQTVAVAIHPGSYSAGYSITAAGHPVFSGPGSFTLIKGLVYGVDDLAFLGGSGFDFQVQPDGSVTTAGPSATGGASLDFVTVPVHVDAGGYPGTYHVGSAGPFSGAGDNNLIAGLVTTIILDDGQGTTFIPTAGGVSPPSFTFNAGQNYTMGFTIGAGFTPAGGGVQVTSGPLDLTFSSVTTPGTTTVTSSQVAPAPPTGFRLGQVRTFYDVTTTATFNGSIEVCLSYAGLGVTRPTRLKLFHYQGGAWVNVTTSNDTVNQVICGTVTSLSPFGIFEPVGQGGDDDDDDHDHDHDGHDHGGDGHGGHDHDGHGGHDDHHDHDGH